MKSDVEIAQEAQPEISDEVILRRANAAVRLALAKHKAMDVPSVVYDRKEQMIYQINPDGTRVPVGKKLREGRYGEWGTAKA
jgi:hypothetical protein